MPRYYSNKFPPIEELWWAGDLIWHEYLDVKVSVPRTYHEFGGSWMKHGHRSIIEQSPAELYDGVDRQTPVHLACLATMTSMIGIDAFARCCTHHRNNILRNRSKPKTYLQLKNVLPYKYIRSNSYGKSFVTPTISCYIIQQGKHKNYYVCLWVKPTISPPTWKQNPDEQSNLLSNDRLIGRCIYSYVDIHLRCSQ